MKTAWKLLIVVPAGIIVLFGGLILYWILRPNTSKVDPALEFELHVAVEDGMHNSNTDLIYWQDAFWLIHQNSPYHFATDKAKLILWRSENTVDWEQIAEFRIPGEDIRDPKFFATEERLILYALKSVEWVAEPYTTAWFESSDGRVWSDFTEMEPGGWLFWRPKRAPDGTWYLPAYWWEHGRSVLLTTEDGIDWTRVALINEGERNDETAIEFLPDGRMIATARLEVSDSIFGDRDASTLISVSEPPYTEWSSVHSTTTRLDGPSLFSYNGRVYAIGRHNPNSPGFLNHFGSILGKKRTSLYLLEPDRMIWLTDLPSAGDTSYSGFVTQGDTLYVSYYTSRIDRDFPWIIGMISQSPIMLAQIDLRSLEALATAKEYRLPDGEPRCRSSPPS